jgi:YT521-B-like domain/RNA recognition motif. (a.k.a. RRM, RBD, or RNP domain)
MEFEPYQTPHPGTSAYPNTPAFNLGTMATALPDYQMRTYTQQPFQQQLLPQGGQNPTILYHLPHGGQFAGQTATNFPPNFPQQYPTEFQHGQHYRALNMNYPTFKNNVSNDPQSFLSQQFYSPQPMLAQTSLTSQNPSFYQHQASQYGVPTSMRAGSSFQPPQVRLDSNLGPTTGPPHPPYPNQSESCVPKAGYSVATRLIALGLSGKSSESSLRPSIPRGPPRKPKQSGHALWVGNLPPATNVIDLKDHFSREATEDIESVFLISKSNCAFVNYKTEQSCAAAMARFHDSRFQGVRLVCRLRRGSAPSSATGTPGPIPGTQATNASDLQPTTVEQAGEQVDSTEEISEKEDNVEKVQEKFFIVKSLTIEDLELSVRNGIWATQAHNEMALNKAYKVSNSIQPHTSSLMYYRLHKTSI